MLVSSLNVGQLLMLQTDFFTTEWESFILKPQRIRRIRIKIQPTRIADRVFADKPPDPWIIVPVPIVVQPCFVIVVLALKPDRIIQSCTPRLLASLACSYCQPQVFKRTVEIIIDRVRRRKLIPITQKHLYLLINSFN